MNNTLNPGEEGNLPDAPRTEAPDLRAALDLLDGYSPPPQAVAAARNIIRAALSSATPAPERLDVDALTERLHNDPSLCKRYSPHGHPRWWLNPPCRQIAARLRESGSPEPKP